MLENLESGSAAFGVCVERFGVICSVLEKSLADILTLSAKAQQKLTFEETNSWKLLSIFSPGSAETVKDRKWVPTALSLSK